MQRVVINSLPKFQKHPTGPTTSVRNCQYSLHNDPGERSSHLRRGGSLKSRKSEFSRLIFEICLNVKFRVNPSSGSRVVLWGRINGRTDVVKLIVAF
jgi:hypothetical protein